MKNSFGIIDQSGKRKGFTFLSFSFIYFEIIFFTKRETDILVKAFPMLSDSGSNYEGIANFKKISQKD